MAEQFYTILTKIGKAKIANATALGTKVNLTKFQVGDGRGSYYNPTEDQTQLRSKVWESNISSITIDEQNPNWIVLEVIIPSDVGGFMIREAAVFDNEGNMIAVGKYPETYKPLAGDGSTKDLIIKMILEVSNASSVTLKVDPTVILATKKDIQILSNDMASFKQKVETQLAEITTDKYATISTQDYVTSLENAIDGFVNIDKIEGNTLVNLFRNNKTFPENDVVTSMLISEVILKPNTTYTQILTSWEEGVQQFGGYDGYNTLVGWTPTQVVKFTTGSEVMKNTLIPHIRYFDKSTGEFSVEKKNEFIRKYQPQVIILEGDHTNKPLPETYFEGMKSVQNIQIKSVYKNLANFTNPITFKAGVAADTGFFPLTLSEPVFSIALYNNGDLLSVPGGDSLTIGLFDKDNKYIDGWTLWVNPRNNMDTSKLNYWKRVRYAKVVVKSTLPKDITITDIMVNGGSTALPYEPYRENKIDILTQLQGDKALKRLPNGVADIFNSDGVVTRKIGKFVLDDGTDWQKDISSTQTETTGFRIVIKDILAPQTNSKDDNLMCSILPTKSADYLWNNDVEGISVNTGKWLVVKVLNIKTGILGQDNDQIKKDKFLAWLKNNHITVLYERAEPIQEQLNIVTSLKCYKGGHIIIDSSIPVPLNIKYPTNFNSEVKSIEETVGKVIQNQQELNNKISNIKVPVESVNGKTGAIVLNSNDIKTTDGDTVEEEINNFQSQIDSTSKYFNTVTSSLDGKIGNVNNKADDISKRTTTAQSTADAAKKRADEAFQYANNGKTLISNVVGSPLLASDTFQQQKDKIQSLKNTLATNLNGKGQSSNGNEALNNLISKVANINLNKIYATGEGTMPLNISNLSFKPRVVLIFSRIDWYILADLPIGSSVAYPLDGKKIWEIGDCNPSRTIEASLNANGFIASESSVNNRAATWYAWE